MTGQEKYARMMEIAQRVHAMRHAKGVALCHEAGLEVCQLHNAVCDQHTRPWRGVDYRKAKRAKYILDVKQWEPTRLVSDWYSRMAQRNNEEPGFFWSYWTGRND